MMGVISSQLVITSSENRGKRKKVQPGSRELVTVTQRINATGWAIPPVLISSWCEATIKRKGRKRRYIQSQETLTVGEAVDLMTPEAIDDQKRSEESRKRVRVGRHCRRCGRIRYNSRICKLETRDAEDSERSE